MCLWHVCDACVHWWVQFLYDLHSIAEHFAPLLCEYRAKHVSISLDVSYQWSKATALNFSQEVSYLTTALSLCLFSYIVRYQDIVATAKQRVKVCRETACSVYTKPHSKHWTYGSEHMVIAKLLSRKHKCVIPKNPLCWRNVISEHTGICTLQSVSSGTTLGSLGIKVRSHS